MKALSSDDEKPRSADRLRTIHSLDPEARPPWRRMAAGFPGGAAFAYAFFAGSVILTLLYLLSVEARNWMIEDKIVLLQPQAWHVYVEDRAAIEQCSKLLAACPEQSSFAPLWTSTRYRAKKGDSPKQTFWLGLQLSADQLEEARKTSAHYLVLGWIRGQFKIFVNGEKIHEGQRSDHEPIAVPFPPSMLDSPGGLSLAVRIDPEAGADQPDVFAKPFHEKLTTARGAHAYLTSTEFYKKTRPFSLFFLNFSFSLLLFFVWFTDRQSRETYTIALFLLVSAALQLRLSDIYLGQFSPTIDYDLDLILRSYEGAFGLMMGLAFARARHWIFRYLQPAFFLAPWLAIAILRNPVSIRTSAFWIERNLLPWALAAGGMACLAQLWYLRRHGSALASRRRRLAMFALATFAIAAIYPLQDVTGSILFRSFLWRFGHFGILLMMGFLAIREIGEQRRFFKKAPISKYHRRIPLPHRLEGWLLTLDLKNSETLSRMCASRGEAGSVMVALSSRLWSAASDHGGIVVQMDGDMLKIFFESTAFSPTAGIFRANLLFTALDALQGALDQLYAQLAEQEMLPPDFSRMAFRGGLAHGHVRPIWNVFENERVPSWSEAGDSTPFVESARLMELERKLPLDTNAFGTNSETRILISRGTVERFLTDLAAPNVLSEGIELADKHGRTYEALIYRPVPRTASLPLAPGHFAA